MAIGNALKSKTATLEDGLYQYFFTTFYASYYLLFKQRRIEQYEYFCANPDMDVAREIWNMLENRYLKRALRPFLTSIAVNAKIQIPMLESPDLFTVENVENRLLESSPVVPYSEIDRSKLMQKRRCCLFGSKSKQSGSLDVLYGGWSNHNPTRHVKVRVLSSKEFPVNLQKGTKQDASRNGGLIEKLMSYCLP